MSIEVQAVYSPDKWGSRFMVWGLGEPASHLAIRFSWGQVLHSELKGVWIEDAEAFDDDHIIVTKVSLPCSPDQEQEIFNAMGPLVGAGYDRGAFTYFAWRAALRKFFRVPLPRTNAGDQADLPLCVEAVYALVDAYARIVGRVPAIDLPKALGMMTPMEALAYLKEAYPCATVGCSPSSWPS